MDNTAKDEIKECITRECVSLLKDNTDYVSLCSNIKKLYGEDDLDALFDYFSQLQKIIILTSYKMITSEICDLLLVD